MANPMQGFLKSLIFSRYLGHADVADGRNWRDCSQCWICEKWDKVKIEFQPTDSIVDSEFEKLAQKLDELPQQMENKELNPIWEEHYESLDDEHESSQNPAGPKKLANSKRVIRDFSRPVGLSAAAHDHTNVPPSSFQASFQASSQRTQESAEPPPQRKDETYDQTIVTVKVSGPADVQVSDLAGKVLYNSHIFTGKLDVEKLQRQIAPNTGLRGEEGTVDSNGVAYRPFTHQSSKAKHQHVIKFPNIYSSQDCTVDNTSQLETARVMSPQKSND